MIGAAFLFFFMLVFHQAAFSDSTDIFPRESMIAQGRAAARRVAPEISTIEASRDHDPALSSIQRQLTAGIVGGAATVIGTTSYDYMWNSGSPQHLVYYNGISHMIYVGQDVPYAGPLECTYVSYDSVSFSTPQPVIPSSVQPTSFSGIDVLRGGLADGFAGVAAGRSGAGNSYYCVESAWTLVTPNRDTQTLVLDENGTVLFEDSQGRTDYRFLISTDFGMNWNEINPGVIASTTLPGVQGIGALEPNILLASNGDVVLVTTLTGLGAIPPVDTTAEADADMWGYFTSTDQGSTWIWTTISVDGEEVIPGYFNLVENFSQVDAVLDNNNNVHAVANGYSVRGDPDTTKFTMDVIYWDPTNGFKSLVGFDRDWDIINDEVIPRTSTNTNAIGCSYPAISISEDGQVVVCLWSQPNFTETTIDTFSNGLMWHDLWYSVSGDGGATWVGPLELTATDDRDETFTCLNPLLGTFGFAAKALYLADDEPGQCPFGGNCTQVGVVYHEFGEILEVRENPTTGLDKCELSQNFPNPFNPSTTITFSLPLSGDMSLKIFNLLGEEVATLVSGYRDAGTHTVQWDAGGQPSGVYFYRFRAENFTETKKLVIVR